MAASCSPLDSACPIIHSPCTLLTSVCRGGHAIKDDSLVTPVRVTKDCTIKASPDGWVCQGIVILGCHHTPAIDVWVAQLLAWVDDRVVDGGHAGVADAEELGRGDVHASLVECSTVSAASIAHITGRQGIACGLSFLVVVVVGRCNSIATTS